LIPDREHSYASGTAVKGRAFAAEVDPRVKPGAPAAVEVTSIVRITDGSDASAPKKEFTLGSGKPGQTTLRLRKTFKDIGSGKNKKFGKWLTYVNGGGRERAHP
jgi:branched-chain amino acid aminotransferase